MGRELQPHLRREHESDSDDGLGKVSLRPFSQLNISAGKHDFSCRDCYEDEF